MKNYWLGKFESKLSDLDRFRLKKERLAGLIRTYNNSGKGYEELLAECKWVIENCQNIYNRF